MISHFGEREWAEFVRDKLALERQEAMKQHLDAGCETCQKALVHCRRTSILVAQSKISRDPLYFLSGCLPFME